MDLTQLPLAAVDLYRFFHTADTETLALKGVSLSVSAGELVVISGASGSGKSTLLACLAGLDDPDGGTVYVGGAQISRRPERDRARIRAAGVGVLFQQWNLLSHLSVAENVVAVQQLAQRRGEGRSSRPEPMTLLEELEIAGCATSYADTLSGGELARAGLAVALAADPAVLIADEPTGELDGDTEQAVLDLIAAQTARGRAVVVASHSAAVEAQGDRVIRLRDGVVVS